MVLPHTAGVCLMLVPWLFLDAQVGSAAISHRMLIRSSAPTVIFVKDPTLGLFFPFLLRGGFSVGGFSSFHDSS